MMTAKYTPYTRPKKRSSSNPTVSGAMLASGRVNTARPFSFTNGETAVEALKMMGNWVIIIAAIFFGEVLLDNTPH